MKISIMVLFVLCAAVQSASAQSNSTDYLTITTYYPSPYGVYGTMRLHPKQQPAQGREGELYYDSAQHVVKVWSCLDRPGCSQMGWVNTSSSGDASNSFTLLHLEPTSPPAVPQRGDVYYDDGLDKVLYWNGTAWGNLTEEEPEGLPTPSKSCTIQSVSPNPWAEEPCVTKGRTESALIQGCSEFCQAKGFVYKAIGCGSNDWIITSAVLELGSSTYNFDVCAAINRNCNDMANVKYCPNGKSAHCYCE